MIWRSVLTNDRLQLLSPVTYTDLHNSLIHSDVGAFAPYSKYVGTSKPEVETYGKLRVAAWNMESMTGRSKELTKTLRKLKVNMVYVQEIKWKGDKLK